MSGRYERDMSFDNRAKAMLETEPVILSEYYYSLIGSGKSYATAYNYICYVINFLHFTFEHDCPDDFYLTVKPIHINKYMTSIRTKNDNGAVKNTSDSFQTSNWSALNSFFQFLVPEYITLNPVASTQRPKMKDNPEVTYLTEKEITKVLKYVENNAQTKFKNRDLCLFKLGFTTGLRVSAIIQIDIDDIDFNNNQIRVTEKGDRNEWIMFGEKLRQQLVDWLKDREEYFPDCDNKALFISQYNTRLSVKSVSKLITKYTKNVTDKHVTPHVMRHSCATNLYEKTGDIYLCASQLHHRNVSTTQRYAEISKSRKKQATNILDNLI